MFEVICKKSYFLRQIVKNVNLSCIILHVVEPTGTQNQDPKPFLDLFQYHKFNSGLKIGKGAFVKNSLFRGKYYCLDLHEFSR